MEQNIPLFMQADARAPRQFPHILRPSYLPFPRFLLALDLSNDAKLLYALLYDRGQLFRSSGHCAPDEKLCFYFPEEEAVKNLHRSRQVVVRSFNELAQQGLIVREKQAADRPALITLQREEGSACP